MMHEHTNTKKAKTKIRKLYKGKLQKKKKDWISIWDTNSKVYNNKPLIDKWLLLQSTLFIPTLDTTTEFVKMTIWMSRNLCSRGDS